MNALLQYPWSVRLGWALLHSLWQGAVLAVMAAVGLYLLRRRSANARYLIGCLALLLAAVAPAVTFLFLRADPSSSSEQPTEARPAAAAPAATATVGVTGALPAAPLPEGGLVDIPAAPVPASVADNLTR